MDGAVMLIVWPPPSPPAANATATATAASTAEAASATVAATAATGPATMDSVDTESRDAYQQMLYSVSLLVPTGLILMMAMTSVRGGLRGFGMDVGNFWRSVGMGAIGFVIVMPLMQGLQIVIELLMAWLHPKKIVVHPVIEMVESPGAAGGHEGGAGGDGGGAGAVLRGTFFRGLLQTIFIQPGRT